MDIRILFFCVMWSFVMILIVRFKKMVWIWLDKILMILLGYFLFWVMSSLLDKIIVGLWSLNFWNIFICILLFFLLIWKLYLFLLMSSFFLLVIVIEDRGEVLCIFMIFLMDIGVFMGGSVFFCRLFGVLMLNCLKKVFNFFKEILYFLNIVVLVWIVMFFFDERVDRCCFMLLSRSGMFVIWCFFSIICIFLMVFCSCV